VNVLTRLILLGSAAACLLTGLSLPQSAGAARDAGLQVEVSGQALASRSGDAFDVLALARGQSESLVLRVRLPVHVGGELRLRFVDTHDDDNGCTPTEAIVDRSCGLGGGELGRTLTFTASSAAERDGAYAVRWTGTAAGLERGADIGALPQNAAQWLRLTAALPTSAGNDVESDSLAFRLRVELQSTHGVAGVAVGPGGTAHAPEGLPLAYTGASTALLVLGGLLLVAAGAMIATQSRRAGTNSPP
jgi:hypothetical protein